MTGTPTKSNLWTLIGENIDLSKLVGYMIPLIILAMGGAWWVITKINNSDLTQYQVAQLNVRMDKMEQSQNDTKVTLAQIAEDIRNLRPKDK